MVWTHAEDRCCVCREQNARRELLWKRKRETKEGAYGRGKGGHAGGGRDREGCG